MQEKGKSINSLMDHIREKHNIEIGDKDSRDKIELLNMGYFHAYKAYKFVRKISNPLLLTTFDEIKDVYNLDNELKALFYPVVMKVETAINNHTIDCVVANSGTDLQSIFENKLNHYKDFEKNSTEYKKEISKFLFLKKSLDTVIANNYTRSDIIQHYIHNNQPVPIWAIFELTTLGDLGNFIERLNNKTREELSKKIGIHDNRFDTNNILISKHLYIIKDLRNAIAHNNPIFDCRFKTGNISKPVLKHLETNLDISKVDFITITDYMFLIAYYMKCLQFTTTEITTFIETYEKIINNYQEKSKKSGNFQKIFGVNSQSKISKFNI